MLWFKRLPVCCWPASNPLWCQSFPLCLRQSCWLGSPSKKGRTLPSPSTQAWLWSWFWKFHPEQNCSLTSVKGSIYKQWNPSKQSHVRLSAPHHRTYANIWWLTDLMGKNCSHQVHMGNSYTLYVFSYLIYPPFQIFTSNLLWSLSVDMVTCHPYVIIQYTINLFPFCAQQFSQFSWRLGLAICHFVPNNSRRAWFLDFLPVVLLRSVQHCCAGSFTWCPILHPAPVSSLCAQAFARWQVVWMLNMWSCF